ncbi:ORF6N domain-containing protein [Flavobacterium marginilacus]|uniref:ORF6N domain-containing protein n=1 Tax=Flavobacterium marginilacus TaxID=3003256 RepID=UPI00248E9587|nr:ORF6N domain-containing protein [Flavobacterium marginilacus]
MSDSIITRQEIENRIYTIRGQQVMLDNDLAMIYQVETKVFNQAVKRNIDRFPESFCFQLTQDEFDAINLRSQFVTSSFNYERCAIFLMLSAILDSDVAVKTSIEIMKCL